MIGIKVIAIARHGVAQVTIAEPVSPSSEDQIVCQPEIGVGIDKYFGLCHQVNSAWILRASSSGISNTV